MGELLDERGVSGLRVRSPATWWTNARTVGARRPRRLARATSLVHLHSRTSHPRGCPCHRSSIHARSHRRSCSAVRSVSLSFLLVSPCSLSARSSRHCTESCTRVRLRAAMLLLRRRRMAGDDGLCLFSPHRALIAPRDFISPHFAIVVFCYCFSFFFSHFSTLFCPFLFRPARADRSAGPAEVRGPVRSRPPAHLPVPASQGNVSAGRTNSGSSSSGVIIAWLRLSGERARVRSTDARSLLHFCFFLVDFFFGVSPSAPSAILTTPSPPCPTRRVSTSSRFVPPHSFVFHLQHAAAWTWRFPVLGFSNCLVIFSLIFSLSHFFFFFLFVLVPPTADCCNCLSTWRTLSAASP